MKNILIFFLIVYGYLDLSANEYPVSFDVCVDKLELIYINTPLTQDSNVVFFERCQLGIQNNLDSKNIDFLLEINMDFSNSKVIEYFEETLEGPIGVIQGDQRSCISCKGLID